MKLEQSFEVQAPLQRVWEALIDVERVAPCLPGAAVTGRNPDGTFAGEFKVKIGPTSASYAGKLQMEDVDEAKHLATMQAAGTDKRGQGGAKATIVSSVADAGAGATTVNVVTDYHITGRLARFGRGGMIEEISNRLLSEFAKSLQAMLEAEPAPAPSPAAEPETAPADSGDATLVDAPATGGNGAASAPATHEEPVAPSPLPEPSGTAVPSSQPTVSASVAGPPEVDGGSPGDPPAAETEPLNGLSLMGKVLRDQVRRNPATVGVVTILVVMLLRLVRRRS